MHANLECPKLFYITNNYISYEKFTFKNHQFKMAKLLKFKRTKITHFKFE